MKINEKVLLNLFLVCFLAVPCRVDAQFWKKKKEEPKKEENTPKPGGKLKSYKQVITAEAESQQGLFTVHKVDKDYYFEIPDSLLNREMLIISRRAAMSGSESDNMVAGERPNGELMVRWEKSPDNEHILLRKITTRNLVQYKGIDESFEQAVNLQTLDPIMVSFPIKTISPDSGSSVIEIADLYIKDVKELTPFGAGDIYVLLGLRAPTKYKFNDDRSFIVDTKSFEQNIEVRSLLTFTQIDQSGTNVHTILMHRSMVLLPEKPMQPRLADERIGHFAIGFKEYHEDRPVENNYYIKRWRLEPKEEDLEKYKNGELVEPQKQIIFYIDSNTPEKWKKYIRQGVKDWQPAFEEAGFKNAIVAKDAPVNDPNYHPENILYSVIRYVASPIPNAKGPSVTDLRSGEILESDVIIYHNVLKLIKEWRFAQTAANDPQVRTTGISDEILGEGLRYVVAHEIGHSLGLRHNMGASSAFPVDSLRSATFTQKYGTTPSIMDYARFNYIAQPEDDGVKVTPPVLGVYDKYAISWAYRPVPLAKNEYEEVETLNKWIADHAGDPWYYFGEGDLQGQDPYSQRESLGDDLVKASRYGVENIKYIIDHLDDWLAEDGAKYTDLENHYLATLKQYNRYTVHVGNLIGGTYFKRPVQGQEDKAYEYVPKEKQREAVKFLLEQYREMPQWLENQELKGKLNIIQQSGIVRKIITPQAYLENLYYSSFRGNLINDGKLMNLFEDEISNGTSAYTVDELFADIRNDIFKETVKGKKLDYYRQLMQNIYVNWLFSGSHFNGISDFKFTSVNHDMINLSVDEMNMCSYGFNDSPQGITDEQLQEYRGFYANEHDLHYQYLNISRFNKRDKITTAVLAEVKQVEKILQQHKNISDPATRAHYDYLLKKIEMFLNKN